MRPTLVLAFNSPHMAVRIEVCRIRKIYLWMMIVNLVLNRLLLRSSAVASLKYFVDRFIRNRILYISSTLLIPWSPLINLTLQQKNILSRTVRYLSAQTLKKSALNKNILAHSYFSMPGKGSWLKKVEEILSDHAKSIGQPRSTMSTSPTGSKKMLKEVVNLLFNFSDIWNKQRPGDCTFTSDQ